MAVCLIVEIPGGTLDQYDAVKEGLGSPSLGEGQISHVAGATDDGFTVVDVWESRAHFDQFMSDRLGEQLGRAEVPQPNITEFEVHNSEQRG
jgi:hypothetical protein